MIEGLTEEQARKLFDYTQALRDKLAIDINQGTLRDTTQFGQVCETIRELRPIFYPKPEGPPAGMVERRGNPRVH